MDQQVTKIKVAGDLRQAVNQAVLDLGGWDGFLRPGETVLLKPNFNTADPYPGSSDREFVAVVADICHEAGAKVVVGDSCTYFLKTANVMKKWGVADLQYGRPWLKVVDFDEGEWVEKRLPDSGFLKSVSVPEIIDKVDRIFLLPCLKTHKLAQFTGALKLGVGLMKPNERLPMHLRRLQEKIAEINLAFRPDLVLMDARKCFISNGPMTGPVREPGLVLASVSRAAVDIEGVKIIQGYAGSSLAGIIPEELPQIKRALELGIER